ncbi:MAG: hypothetical protein WDO74_17895 [Pseudomonadota bacterium]
MLQGRPKIYGNIFVFGAGRSTGEPTIGGFLGNPNLGLSYLLAARHVIEAGARDGQLNEIALPAAYLQRHALELELKSWIASAFRLKDYYDWDNRHGVNPMALLADPRTVELTHNHQELCAHLNAALADVNVGPLPEVVTQVAGRIVAAEAEAPERFRYSMVAFGKKAKKKAPLKEAFESQETIAIVATQNELERVFEDVFFFDDGDIPEDQQNLATQLGHAIHEMHQILASNYPS